ncbi:LLM class flavin-dependent oxidoreductase [Actinocrispum wychmicini]|uniref:Alkanesulfonate monooxygenase SsuD/methylene tetrahydromethanopterin reductase-like flavin-dependent oxidoreductase (Luciferase family) n=1 Tax=Actinocrispum wychmicini TaxID=1213861 RepID=A0A4R2IIQ7_9PSEU|nr:LLM class flavin-dependent oxidoreductase [Actinocrispum wychmicini]TCO44773.1 alkanesulfonate monooxygenase SsuD/methylene tetrahydromethanopterin reductase-like flavin-dependent oxidoreductase (luciferase family) [Actinocrispum wychmicini]
MEYGLSLLPDCDPDTASASRYFSDVLEASVLAETLGLGYVKMTEHYLSSYGGYCPSPLAFLSAVAARTRSVRLMTGGIQASFHHPVQIAAQAAQLDVLSRGRLDVGFARAFLPYEFEAFGVDLDSSRERFVATIDAVVRLWTESDVSEETPFFRYAGANSLPMPVQQPAPPVWIAALATPASFVWAAERGFNLLISSTQLTEMHRRREGIDLYRNTFLAKHGPAGRRPKVAVSIPLLIADTDDEARDVAVPLMLKSFAAFKKAILSWENVESPAYAGYTAMARQLASFDLAAEGLEAKAMVGSPDTVRGRLDEVRDVLDPDVVLWNVDFGGQSLDTMARTLTLFADKVMPAGCPGGTMLG